MNQQPQTKESYDRHGAIRSGLDPREQMHEQPIKLRG